MRQILKGSTDRSVDLYIIDSTDGTPEVGVLFNTAGIDLKYRRDLSAAVSITEVTLAALTTAHADGGFLEIGNGVYRLDLPDAAFATGADHVTIYGTVTGMIVLPVTVQLINFDPEAALATPTNITAGTITTVTTLTNLPAITANWLTAAGIAAAALNGKGDWNIGKTGYALSAAGIQAIWDALTSALTTAGSIGKLLVDNINATISSRSTYAGGAVASVTADVTIGAAGNNAIADALLNRNVAGGSSAGRLVKEALFVLRNKIATVAGTMTVYGTDDTTAAFTAAVTTSPSNPIDSIDPA